MCGNLIAGSSFLHLNSYNLVGSVTGERPNPFATARLANRTQQEQGNSPGSGRHMSPNAIMNVRPTLHYVGTCAWR